jgi:hypothetical protein
MTVHHESMVLEDSENTQRSPNLVSDLRSKGSYGRAESLPLQTCNLLNIAVSTIPEKLAGRNMDSNSVSGMVDLDSHCSHSNRDTNLDEEITTDMDMTMMHSSTDRNREKSTHVDRARDADLSSSVKVGKLTDSNPSPTRIRHASRDAGKGIQYDRSVPKRDLVVETLGRNDRLSRRKSLRQASLSKPYKSNGISAEAAGMAKRQESISFKQGVSYSHVGTKHQSGEK